VALKFHSGDSSLSVAEGKHEPANGGDPWYAAGLCGSDQGTAELSSRKYR
jgi:hypothetical protein